MGTAVFQSELPDPTTVHGNIPDISVAKTHFTSALSRAWAEFTNKPLSTLIPSGQQQSCIPPKRRSHRLTYSMTGYCRTLRLALTATPSPRHVHITSRTLHLGARPFQTELHWYNACMRLDSMQIRVIRDLVRFNFGDEAQTRLFGSRVDEGAVGGDIDLLIELPEKPALAREIALISQLEQRLDCPVDVITTWPGQPTRPIVEIARLTGMPI